MTRYSKYFLQHSLWLDDGFCQYYVQDSTWGRQEILDVETVIFDFAADAERWLDQCRGYDESTTLRRLRSYLADHSLELFNLHGMSDRQVMRTAARQVSRNAEPVVIDPRMGWAVRVDAKTHAPLQPICVEPAADIDSLLSELKADLDALVVEQQKKHDRYEAQLSNMSEAERAAFWAQKTGGTLWDGTGGGVVALAKAAPGAIWDAAKAFPGFYTGYLKTLWKIAQTPGKMAALTTEAIVTGNANPLKAEIDKIVDPLAQTYEQATEYKSMLTILSGDPTTYDLLYDFAKRYYKATHPVELAQMGVSAATDILVTVILAFFTAGVGAAANIAAKSTRLVSVFKKLKKIAATIKKMAPSNKLPGRIKNAAESVRKKKKPPVASKRMPEVEKPKVANKLDAARKKEYGADNKGDGPKTTLEAKPEQNPTLKANSKPDEDLIKVYRGDRAGSKVIKSRAAQEKGYRASQDIIDNEDLDDLMMAHAIDSSKPPSPFISTTTDRRVADFLRVKTV